MAKRDDKFISLKGVRHNNLKGFDVDIPLGKLIVVTGLSGSGKSSFAFDTLYAEGQRRYIETFSPYARQFFDRMDKPQVDRIDGIPPAIAIEQRNSVRTTRSTVGTMTEVCDFMKVLWPHLSRLFCHGCGQEVGKDSAPTVWKQMLKTAKGRRAIIAFELPVSKKLSVADSLKLISKQGYQRLLIDGEPVRVDEAGERLGEGTSTLTVIQDRTSISSTNRSRFVEACVQAYHFGKGYLIVLLEAEGAGSSEIQQFSNRYHCAACDIDYREPTGALFSFNHPVGACPECKGFGRIITIDYELAIPDRNLSLAGGAVKPWRGGFSADCQSDLKKFCKANRISMKTPFRELPEATQRWVIEGDPDYGSDEAHEWPRAWYGVKGYFRWLESKSYKMHVRVLLSRYRAYSACPACRGKRLKPEGLAFRLPKEPKISLADFYDLPIAEADALLRKIRSGLKGLKKNDPIALALDEVGTRIGFLNEVGLGYLTLNRSMRTLSGGETERVSLTSCIGTRLVNTLYVLDEPSVGLHPRDTERLIGVMKELRDLGNTVVVVEHEAGVMRAADQILDLGPGHGESGGELVFQGKYSQILKSKKSLTGKYLSGVAEIEIPKRRKRSKDWLHLMGAHRNNLQVTKMELPLARLVCVTGVSGSGKTTLIREELLPALRSVLGGEVDSKKASDRMEAEAGLEEEDAPTPAASGVTGWESLGRVVLVDQSTLGKTPRSNPAVYIGAFEDIRQVFARTEAAKERGMNHSSFSFNSVSGQCERCRGAGFEKIEMQFLSDVFVKCPACDGCRYQSHILEIRIGNENWSIADVLGATIEVVIGFLAQFDSRYANRAQEKLKLLQEVGLGYLRLGQPINTLSGGECQRLKLVSHLADVIGSQGDSILFLFDEPTTGLHFDDVRVLHLALQRLVEAGHSVVVIEHNLDLIKCADWVIDLGPEAGADGGKIVAVGTPETIAQNAKSHTGRYLKTVLPGK
ncbi:MAG: excinuclease ABC subunit A [Limisphaerales bacterium]